MPVYEGELQARALGAAVESWDEDGKPLIGEVGELVITEPMPSMPISFWGDEDGSRYREAYFETYPGVGATATGSRSPSAAPRSSTGARTRPSTAAASAWERPRSTARCSRSTPSWTPGGRRPGRGLRRVDAAVRRAARGRVADRRGRGGDPQAGARGLLAAPRADEVIEVDEVPRTLSGKVLELPVKRILMGTPVEKAAARDSLANPAALDAFVELAEARA